MILVLVRDGLYHNGNCITVNLLIGILFWKVLHDSNMSFQNGFWILLVILSVYSYPKLKSNKGYFISFFSGVNKGFVSEWISLRIQDNFRDWINGLMSTILKPPWLYGFDIFSLLILSFFFVPHKIIEYGVYTFQKVFWR